MSNLLIQILCGYLLVAIVGTGVGCLFGQRGAATMASIMFHRIPFAIGWFLLRMMYAAGAFVLSLGRR